MPHPIDVDGSLFEQLRPRLKAISCRIVGSDAQAEDIVQDCFLKWQAVQQAALVTPAAWLTTVVQHQSIDYLRQRTREVMAALTAMELVPEVPPMLPEEHLLQRAELGEALACLLALLSPAERMALLLYEVFDYSHADIAGVLGTSTTNARQYLARARRRLRSRGMPVEAAVPAGENLCRDLIRRFEAALNGMDVPLLQTLLLEEQPLSVHASPPVQMRSGVPANDASYGVVLAA
jgi:RNA polymerase sigma factor (sigma-70 family)